MASELPKFFPTWGFVCGCMDSSELPAGVGRWKHTWWLSDLVSQTLSADHLPSYVLARVLLLTQVIYTHVGTFKAAVTNTDDSTKEAKRQRAASLSSPFPSFVLPASHYLRLMHPHTQTHTSIVH